MRSGGQEGLSVGSMLAGADKAKLYGKFAEKYEKAGGKDGTTITVGDTQVSQYRSEGTWGVGARWTAFSRRFQQGGSWITVQLQKISIGHELKVFKYTDGRTVRVTDGEKIKAAVNRVTVQK